MRHAVRVCPFVARMAAGGAGAGVGAGAGAGLLREAAHCPVMARAIATAAASNNVAPAMVPAPAFAPAAPVEAALPMVRLVFFSGAAVLIVGARAHRLTQCACVRACV